MITNAHKVILEEKTRLANKFNLTVEHITKLKNDYLFQSYACKNKLDKNKNKVDMKLTFEQWLQIWVDSGKIHQRGKRIGEYCMCRKDDIGHYEIGNVYIDLASKNSSMAPVAQLTDEEKERRRRMYAGKPRPKEMWEKVQQTKLANGRYRAVYCQIDNKTFVSISEAAKYYRVDPSTISDRCKRRIKGFQFA